MRLLNVFYPQGVSTILTEPQDKNSELQLKELQDTYCLFKKVFFQKPGNDKKGKRKHKEDRVN